MQHDLLEWIQEVFLEVEAGKLLLEQELVGQLTKRVDGENRHVEVLVGPNVDKVLAEHLPDPGPNEPDSGHVQVCDLDKGLQTKLARVDCISQFLTRHFAKVLDEQDDCILVQIQTALKDLDNLGHVNGLHDHFTICLSVLLTHGLVCS